MHVPQSLVTENELAELAAVPTQVISPRECKPIISIVQDIALGVYRLTKPDVRISEPELFNLMSHNTRFVGIIPKPIDENENRRLWSGQQLLSSVIPNNINIETPNMSHDDEKNDKHNYVIIKNGEIKQGIIDKSIYQKRTKGLVHSIYNECGSDETRQFFDNTQRLICDWLVLSGFSVGISDLILPEEDINKMKKEIKEMKREVYNIIGNIHKNEFDTTKSMTNNNEYFEEEVNRLLNTAIKKVGNLGMSKIDDTTNRMINMVKAGSKGSKTNVSQMISFLGQQNVDGRRISYGFNDRTLPHYNKYDDGPESRGFVENSFLSGLTPQEFFFHSMGGREGLIDTAVKTAETGYIQRRLIKAMEDCKIYYDYTVRNASGSIIQFLYGEDGMDSCKIENQEINYVHLDVSSLRNMFLINSNDDFKYLLNDETIDQFHNTPDWELRLESHYNDILIDRDFIIKDLFNLRKNSDVRYPISFNRIIMNCKAQYNEYGMNVLNDLSPIYVLNEINLLCDQLQFSKHNKGNKLLSILIRNFLSPKRVVKEYRFCKLVFDHIIQDIKFKYYDSIANPSEMVGVVAAQSIGEPCTQMSCHKNTIIRVISQNSCYNGPICEFIDNLLNENQEMIINLDENSQLLDLPNGYNIVGVSNDEKVSWSTISQISRHPSNGRLVKIKTLSGKNTCATLSHSFLKRGINGIEPILGSDLNIGDRIPIAKSIPEIENPINHVMIDEIEILLDKNFGIFVGLYIADGSINHHEISIAKVDNYVVDKTINIANSFNCKHKIVDKEGEYGLSRSTKFIHKEFSKFLSNNFGNGSYNKKIENWIFGSNKQFISGILSGYFDGDGNTNSEKQQIRCGSRSENLTNDICILLSYFSIFASKIQEKSIKIPDKILYTLSIQKKYAELFRSKIGLNIEHKKNGLDQICIYNSLSNERIDVRDMIDMIPSLGHIIAELGTIFKLPSRIYKRWINKDAIGRRTLQKYIENFVEANLIKNDVRASMLINQLNDAAESDIIWDKIIELEIIDDPHEYVYDFTVPGNDTFMVDNGILVHNTLNTFHLSGVASASKAVRGVPRMKELLSVTKNIKTPVMTIYVLEQYNQDKEKCHSILNNIQTTYFRDIIKTCETYYDFSNSNTTIDDDKLFIATYQEHESRIIADQDNLSPWLLRFEFSREKMNQYDITMLDLYHTLTSYYNIENNDGMQILFSDDNAYKLVLRIKLIEDSNEERDMITELKALEKSILDIDIKGIKKINKVVMNKVQYPKYNFESMSYEDTYEWILETSGTNLLEILSHKFIDAKRTISNDINEILAVFGIEAARQALYNEIYEVISSAELYVNFRHIALLVDTMTNRGYLLSIDRHGINRGDIGPLAKCSFEETTDMLIKAGTFSELDKINGVSANIILGQIPPAGTGDTDILIDDELLQSTADYNLDPYMELSDDEETISNECIPDDFIISLVKPAENDIMKQYWNLKLSFK